MQRAASLYYYVDSKCLSNMQQGNISDVQRAKLLNWLQ